MLTLIRKPSVIALIVANLVPLLGVIFFGWDLQTILLLYWAESAVIGFFSVLKMLKLGGIAAAPACVFFCIHYGIFMMVHLFFLLMLTNFNRSGPSFNGPEGILRDVLGNRELWLGLVGLFLSHGFSFVYNFLRDPKPDVSSWLPTPPGTMNPRLAKVSQQFSSPYGRIFVMHFTIMVSTLMIVFLFGPSALMLAAMVVFKTIVDVMAHARQHQLTDAKSDPNLDRAISPPSV